MEVDTAGDGFFATFDGPARAVRCACALAATSELLVTSTVQMLVLGSGIQFADRGTHVLKGVAEPWQLFSVEHV